MPDDPASWPRRQVIPPGVWTELEHAPGSVLREARTPATVTVDADGTVTISGPMRWRPEGSRQDLLDRVVVDGGARDQDVALRARNRRTAAERAGRTAAESSDDLDQKRS